MILLFLSWQYHSQVFLRIAKDFQEAWAQLVLLLDALEVLLHIVDSVRFHVNDGVRGQEVLLLLPENFFNQGQVFVKVGQTGTGPH